MSSKINLGIFAIATLSLMVAGTIYGGMVNAYAIDFSKISAVGNFAAVSQRNNVDHSNVGVSAAASASVGGNGGNGGGGVTSTGIPIPGGAGGAGGAGGTATAVSTATGTVSQNNGLTLSQTTTNTDKCGCDPSKDPSKTLSLVGNAALVGQSNSVSYSNVGVSSAEAASVGGNGGNGGVGPTSNGGAGGAGGAATATSSATGTVSQNNGATITQVTTNTRG